MGSNRERALIGEELARMEREDRQVAEAAASYERMSRRVREESGGLRQEELARIYDLDVTLCSFGSCTNAVPPQHNPCCSSHGNPLCCGCYAYTHFVETGCCTDGKSLSHETRDEHG